MRKKDGVLMRQLAAAIILSALAIAAIAGAIGPAAAADLSPGLYPLPARSGAYACPPKEEAVILFDEEGKPTVPARTPYFTCVTNTVLLPGEIPPPPEYCCH
jgi:hypothetical protein